MNKASELISSAVTTIVLDHPFFATLMLQMPLVEDPSVPTACTNGVHIRYNPGFIESLTPSQVAGLLVHEVLHPALGHLHRLPPDREGNIAGDYAINNFLDNYNNAAGNRRRLDLPEGGCLDHKYDGMSAEEILADIRKNRPTQPPPPPPVPINVSPGDGDGDPQDGDGDPQDGDGDGNGEGQGKDEGGGKSKGQGGSGQDPLRTREQGGWGEFEQQAATPDASAADMKQEWERRLIQAATACKMQGALPGCIEALVKDLVDPKVPWQQLLARFFDATSTNDYSWRKPDRRFLPDDIIVPDLMDETLGHVVVALDTSGSIYGSPQTLASFQSELNSILQRCKPERVTVLHCDAAIQHVEEFDGTDPVELKPKGGGGTDFRPVGDYIAQNNISPRAVVYLTDLYGTFPDTEWPFPTIWVVYENPDGVAPFGDTVTIND